jgi:hypothetical protein
VRHIARVREIRNPHKMLDIKPEGGRHLRRYREKW